MGRGRYLGFGIFGAIADLQTLDAPEIAAFMTGQMGDLFIETPKDLQASLRESRKLMADGLYPILDYYCRDNSWRPTVVVLMAMARRVYLDLRGFSKANMGVRYEIDELAARVSGSAITVIYDESTDIELGRKLVKQAWAQRGSVDNPPDTLTFAQLPK